MIIKIICVNILNLLKGTFLRISTKLMLLRKAINSYQKIN